MSASWRVVGEEEAARSWDQRLLAFPDASLTQAYTWGRHKANLDQEVLRLAGERDSGTAAMAQAFIQRKPLGTAVAWLPGGPVGEIAAWDGSFRDAIVRAVGARRALIRVRPYIPYSAETAFALQGAGWTRALRPLDSGWTIFVTLGDEESARQALTTNWRHNLKRAESRGPAPHRWERPAPGEVMEILRRVEAYKNMPGQYAHSEEEIASLASCFKDGLLLWRCDDAAGKPAALRACVVFGPRGYDLLAGSTEEGRKLYSSYALLWRLLSESRARGAVEFDLGGVDPRETGVLNFKRGLGGRLVEHAGEWEWASSKCVLWGANLLIEAKFRRR